MIPTPAGQQLIPPAVRHLVPGFCSRCHQPAELRLAAGQDALCKACTHAEAGDLAARRPRSR